MLKGENEMDKLNVLWTNDNPQTAHTMVFMYATNGKLKGWWDEVDVIIWGATAKLVAENKEIQDRIAIAQQAGVNILACIACATQFGVVEALENLNIDVKPMGEPLTQILKTNATLLTI